MSQEKENALPEQQSDRAMNWSPLQKSSHLTAPILPQTQLDCQEVFRIDLNLDSKPYHSKAEAKAEYGMIRNRLRLIPGFPLHELPVVVTQGYTFTPAAMTGTGGESWQSQQLFCVDIDNESNTVLTPQEAVTVLNAAGIPPLFMYYSFSSTPERPRFRIIVATTEPITDFDRADRIRKGLISLFPEADKSATDPARMFLGTNRGLALEYTGKAVPPETIEHLYELYKKSDEESEEKVTKRLQTEKVTKRLQISPPEGEEKVTKRLQNEKVTKSNKENRLQNGNKEGQLQNGNKIFPTTESLTDAIENFNLAGYIEQDTGTRGKHRGNRVFFNPCPICGHKDDFDVNGPVFICRSASGLNGGGGNIINYLEYRNGWNREQAREYFMYSILGWDRQGRNTAYAHQLPVEQQTRTSVKPSDFTDVGNSKVFVREYGDRLCYTDGLGWLYWNGVNWEPGEHHALDMAKALSERMLTEAAELSRKAQHTLADSQIADLVEDNNIDKPEQQKLKKAVSEAHEYIQHAKYTRRVARLKAILELSVPDLVIPDKKIDADPMTLNTPSGIFNLKDGTCHPNMPQAYCTKVTSVAPGTDGTELWQDFINTITCGDIDLADFLQQIAGMALVGTVYQEGAIFAIGNGRNGKSTFFGVLRTVLADYAGTINVDALMINKHIDKAAMTSLRGKRLIITGELEEGRWLSSAMLKRICSTDEIAIEPKYKEAFSIKPSHTLCLFTNHLPKVSSRDESTWRRIIVVPFNAKIDEKSAIQNYADYLAKYAGSAVLAWAIEGAQTFIASHCKLKIPESVKQASKAYREAEDWLSSFLNDCCDIASVFQVKASDLYNRYRAYTEDHGITAHDSKRFAYEIESAGFNKKHTMYGWIYSGLKLRQ